MVSKAEFRESKVISFVGLFVRDFGNVQLIAFLITNIPQRGILFDPCFLVRALVLLLLTEWVLVDRVTSPIWPTYCHVDGAMMSSTQINSNTRAYPGWYPKVESVDHTIQGVHYDGMGLYQKE